MDLSNKITYDGSGNIIEIYNSKHTLHIYYKDNEIVDISKDGVSILNDKSDLKKDIEGANQWHKLVLALSEATEKIKIEKELKTIPSLCKVLVEYEDSFENKRKAREMFDILIADVADKIYELMHKSNMAGGQ